MDLSYGNISGKIYVYILICVYVYQCSIWQDEEEESSFTNPPGWPNSNQCGFERADHVILNKLEAKCAKMEPQIWKSKFFMFFV